MKKSHIIVLVLLVAAIIGLLIWNFSQRQELNEMVEQMTIEKEELQEEYRRPRASVRRLSADGHPKR